MSQSIATGYIPPGQPQGKFFERANPGQLFLANSLPQGKNDGRIPGGGANFPLKLTKKSKRNSEKFETVQIFCLENLTKLLYFGLKQTTRKSLNAPSLIFN